VEVFLECRLSGMVTRTHSPARLQRFQSVCRLPGPICATEQPSHPEVLICGNIVFGHIHGGHGQLIANGMRFVNASVVNEAYRLVHDPQVVEIDVSPLLEDS
jgi:hypothetical protein